MNQDHLQTIGRHQALEGRLNSFELAFRMQSAMPESQDLSEESTATQQLHGIDNAVTEDFGRQCLMARRFLERGVLFVQVTHSVSEVQWDQHANLYHEHTKNAAEVDRPIAGFLADLKGRGTLGRYTGSFGVANSDVLRLPRETTDVTITLTDSQCGWPVEVSKADTLTDPPTTTATTRQSTRCTSTICTPRCCNLMGINHKELTFRYAGRDFRLTDVAGNVATDIMA